MRVFTLVLLVLLASCAAQKTLQLRDNMKAAGYPAEYIDGYADGYNSGTAAAGNPYYRFIKDVNRTFEDEKYKEGWKDGYDISKSQYESLSRSVSGH